MTIDEGKKVVINSNLSADEKSCLLAMLGALEDALTVLEDESWKYAEGLRERFEAWPA